MSFLAPLFLLGGLAVTLPVIFHLVRRSSREKQIFSSLMFLKPTPPRMTRRNRLEHIFLLLLRCLVLGLLAFAFARPFLQKPMAATPTNLSGAHVVILVDTSASMKREGLWEAAISKADAALRNVSPGDQVALLTFDRQVRTLVSFEQWTGMPPAERPTLTAQRLGTLQPTWHATQLGNALISAAEIIEAAEKRDQPPGPRRIVVVTDLQEGSRLDGLQGHEWPQGLEVVVETVKAKRPTNAGLHWVMDTDDGARTTTDTPVRLRVNNSSDALSEQFQIRWGGSSDSLDAYVPPGQSRMVPAPGLPTNLLTGRVTLTGDDDDFDNTAYVVQPQAEEVNVAYLGGDAETDSSQSLYYLRRAFQETRRQVVRLNNLNPLAPPSGALAAAGGASERLRVALATSRLVIVTTNLAEETSLATRQFLTNGGTALLVMNDPQIARTLGQLTGASEVTATEATVANYAMFGAVDITHPLLAPFADPRFGDFTKVRFWKHRTLTTDRLPGARVIASYDNASPAVLEVPVGRGRIFVFTFSWRPSDSQFALSSKFVPLLYSLLDQSGAAPVALAQVRVGDTVELATLLADRGAATVVRKPDGTSVALAAGETRFTQTDQPGVYEIAGAPVPVRFAVNLDAAESKTAPLPADELVRLGVPMKAGTSAVAPLLAAQQQTLHNTELEARQKLWRWLLLAALTVLFVETWLAGWITRRATAPVEATP